MKILFIGDAAATGFGTVTYDLGGKLLEIGEDVRFMSMNLAGVLPPEPFGSRTYDIEPNERPEAVLALLLGNDDWSPDVILMVSDFYSARWVTMIPEVMAALKRVPAFHYCPIEGVGIPNAWRDLWDVVRPVAMSKFGQAEMARVMGYEPPMVYHGVDQDVFYPIAPNHPAAGTLKENGARPTNKAAAKVMFGLDPNRTVILRTDRHMPRKRYASLIRSLYPVFAKHPDVDLVIHCRIWDEGGHLFDILRNYPDWFVLRVKFTNAHDSFTGYTREVLNVLYNAADLYCTVSAEGFGLTVAEALACGVPVVGIDYSAVPEVIGPAGVAVPVAHLLDNEYAHFWAAVDEKQYAEAVDRLLSKPALRRSLGSQGPRHVAANFDWRKAAEQFVTIFQASLIEEAA